MAILRRALVLPLCMAAALLAGCAGPRLVESDVNSFSTLSALPSPPTYRIERLPSQEAHSAAYIPIEAQAEQALARVGLQRDDARPRLIAQIGAEGGYASPRYWPYYSDPFYGRFGWGLGYGGRWGWGMGMGWMMDTPPTLYHRGVSLVLRDAATQQVVYETSGVLFNQALSGFPQPPRGRRTIRTEVLPQSAARPTPQPATPATVAPAPAR
jgi:hypothetical protein